VRLAHGDADVIVRLSRPREDDAVARRLASIHLSLYASKEYLARHGVPDKGDALAGHAVILFARSSAFELENEWLAPRVAGARVALRSDSVSSIYAAALAGAGIALLPRSVADAEPRLQRLLTESAPEPRVIWQGVHRDLVRSARVQAVTAFLAEVVSVAPEGEE
jgi:DNA-binding transcriptional LysR family regulator